MNKYIDLHCDTLAEGVELGKKNIVIFPERCVDILRLEKGGAKAQFFAAYLDQDKSQDTWADFLAMHDLLETTAASTDKIAITHNYDELQANDNKGIISAFLTVENGCLVEGDFDKLKQLKNMGVSLITLTWNQTNCFGNPHSGKAEEMSLGLTPFGKEAIEVMNDLGIIIDVSHLSDGGFYDVASISKKPFVASHSDCRSISPHTRNLTDEMIKVLADKGGIAGLNFAPDFLEPDMSKEHSRIEMMVKHVHHMINLGGIEFVGIGTDFDGVTGELEINSCDKMPLLFDALLKSGITESQLDYIAYKNAERIIKECL